jgi:hypothetical protein
MCCLPEVSLHWASRRFETSFQCCLVGSRYSSTPRMVYFASVSAADVYLPEFCRMAIPRRLLAWCSFWNRPRFASSSLIAASDVTLMMDAGGTPETSVNFHQSTSQKRANFILAALLHSYPNLVSPKFSVVLSFLATEYIILNRTGDSFA